MGNKIEGSTHGHERCPTNETLIGDSGIECGNFYQRHYNFQENCLGWQCGILTHANLEPGWITLCSEFLCSEIPLFISQLQPRNKYKVKALKIDASEQKADIFTKGLSISPFQGVPVPVALVSVHKPYQEDHGSVVEPVEYCILHNGTSYNKISRRAILNKETFATLTKISSSVETVFENSRR